MATVVLAAGQSTRMGSENKLLMEIEPGVPVIRRTVEHALEIGLTPLYVVTGHEAAEIRAALSDLDCRFVHNPAFADGLSGSVRAGFRQAVSDGASGVLVLLGDMPFLPAEAVEAVLEEAAADPGKPVQAVHAGKPAHPVWLPSGLSETVNRLAGDRGMRSLVAETGGEMVAVEVGDDAVVDIDTPKDFAAARAREIARDD
jgi:molybdenum cofactor cytidylyltransferase